MIEGNSRSITSNQLGVHDDLDKVVKKHLSSDFKKPYAPHSLSGFEQIKMRVSTFLLFNPNGTIILDSCCGVGESTYHLAVNNPDALVIGIDKSEHRIEKYEHHHQQTIDNFILIRGDLNDLWRLIAEADWPISHHYILYPNPWPKSKHLQRRWHGAPVFKYIPQLSEKLTVRSNWAIYIEEFTQALTHMNVKAEISDYKRDTAMTPFERKYWASGQKSTELNVTFNNLKS
ncbi:methyltransferase domain-containing protein [Psychrosphaera aquimarina]|uniref:tRNA (guanine(46)-N(7))-methyltransferase n=1 Tax=Psychrosphaera aquimarina TaxID=2044854 RepID=A0ABU3R1R8_9GAMM|nr:methyltransferase domain-containing protein [Psychrosphaera aquimarina]MDU0113626.1 methyltransferase domain-containing protein [Psychrosphaera aquimarina]